MKSIYLVYIWCDPDSAIGNCCNCTHAGPYDKKGGMEDCTELLEAYAPHNWGEFMVNL